LAMINCLATAYRHIAICRRGLAHKDEWRADFA